MISCLLAPAISRVKTIGAGGPSEGLNETASLSNNWPVCKTISLNCEHTPGGRHGNSIKQIR